MANPSGLQSGVHRMIQARQFSENSPRIDVDCPVSVTATTSGRGCLITVPLAANEAVYGFGLQLQSFLQRATKKRLRVNADPRMDTGDTHAPVPFYVTTRGYGVLIDTARYATVYAGGKKKKSTGRTETVPDPSGVSTENLPVAYRRLRMGEASAVLIEILEAQGVDVYVFGGPSMRAAVQRYNLYSGGGALPPRWGLGMSVRNAKTHGRKNRGKVYRRRLIRRILGRGDAKGKIGGRNARC